MQRKWSQAELARRAKVPRTSVGAIESERLTPSVTAALKLARVLDCSVEELFGGNEAPMMTGRPEWAWIPRGRPCRYWEAELGGRRFWYPVESLSMNVIAHDGVWDGEHHGDQGSDMAEQTLVLACCDPAAGMLAAEYARISGFRLVVFHRGGSEAIALLKRGLVHIAGLHRSTKDYPRRNVETVRSELGENYRLVHVADWQEGIAISPNAHLRSTISAAKKVMRWALRETGSAARECLEEIRAGARGPTVYSHFAVAEAVRSGWADAGVCVKVSAEEAGLSFLPVRTETLDFCFSEAMQHDARIQAMIRLLRSAGYRRLISELPGYDARQAGEVFFG